MRLRNIPLGRILGIEIGLDYSWFLVFVFLTWLLARNYYPVEFSHWSQAEYWLVSAATAILLFVCVLLHELGHSIVSMQYKIKVKRITLFIFGGIAQIAGEPPKASAEFWIAVAGPIVSLILAGIFYLLTGVSGGIPWLLGLFKYLALINLVLAIFNLIPGFPLDGGRVFRAIVWGISHSFRKATTIASNVGRFFGFLFIFWGGVQIFAGDLGNGLWIAFIGWFLERAATAERQQLTIHDLIGNHRVSEAMRRNFTIIPADTTLQQLVDHHILGNGQRSFMVERGEHPLGLLTLHRVREISREKWPTTHVTDVMIPERELQKVTPDTSLWDALRKMDENGVNQMPVEDNGIVVGILTRESIITFLRNQQEFGS